MFYWLIRDIAALLCKILFHTEVFGRQNIPKKGGFILASNHVSHLDPVVLSVVSPRKINFMAREDLFHNPLFGAFIRRLCAFPVKRSSADLSALKEAMRRIKNNSGLLLFPEGRRRAADIEADMQAEPGIGFLAAKLSVPIIPVFVKGTEIALPKGARFIRPHKVCVYFGKALSIEKNMSYQDIADKAMQNIRQLGL